MRSLVLLAVLTLVVTPAFAQILGPTPGVYRTLAGDFSNGVFSESWVDPPNQEGVVHNTIHAWDNGGGIEWAVYCPSILQVTLLIDTRDANGNGFVKYSTDYTGGTLWLSKAGPWGHNQIDFTATITSFNVTSTHHYFMWQKIQVDSDIIFSGQFDPPVEQEQCFQYTLSNGAIEGSTDMGPLPAGYPPFLDYYNCPGGTVGLGAWGTADDISLSIYGDCTVAAQPSTWGKIKSLYSE